MRRPAIVLVLILVVGLTLASTGCQNFAEIADRLKTEVLAPFQTAFKASMFAFFDQQLAVFAPQMQDWLLAELKKLFDTRTQEIIKLLCPVK